MTWSWSGDPATSELDEVRFYVQDTDETFPLISDEEISFLLDRYMPQFGHTLAVAAMVCEVLAAKFARQVDVSADGVSVSMGQLQQRYNDLAVSLRDQYKVVGAANLATSLDAMFADISVFEVEPLVFGVGFMDNFRVGQQDYGYYHPGQSHWHGVRSPGEDAAAWAIALSTESPDVPEELS